MLEYVNGAILESIARATALKSKFPSARKTSIYFEPLVATARGEIDLVIKRLNALFYDVDYSKPENVKQKFSKLKSITGDLHTLENVVIAAIDRRNIDDDYINKLVRSVCSEINYPLRIPVASCMSQNYYQIFPHYNLLCLPLLEAEFLLHLPDLYHELSHPLLALRDPQTDAFRESFGRFNRDIRKHFTGQISRLKLNTTNDLAVKMRYTWRDSWIKKWSEEFFCDLFATFTLGPAYVWSNLHMCVKMEWDVFYIPLYVVSATPPHPPCDARMRAMFHALTLLGFEDERKEIETKWNEFVSIIEATPSAEYHIAIQDSFLKLAADYALDGIKAMGCTLASENKDGDIIKILNKAWATFWENPSEFSVLEKETIKSLKQVVNKLQS